MRRSNLGYDEVKDKPLIATRNPALPQGTRYISVAFSAEFYIKFFFLISYCTSHYLQSTPETRFQKHHALWIINCMAACRRRCFVLRAEQFQLLADLLRYTSSGVYLGTFKLPEQLLPEH